MPRFNTKILNADFVRNTSVKKDIYKLKSLIENPPETSLVMEITPNMAHYVINELNKNNRPVKPAHLVRYARDMASNNWGLTGETIKFGLDGLLKDGQNRLMACFKSGHSFKSHVVFGVKPETFYQMDIGATRDGTDMFHIMGVPNSKYVAGALKLIMAWENNYTFSRSAQDNETLKKYYENKVDEDLIQRSIKAANSVFKIVKLQRNNLVALYYLASLGGNEVLVNKFFEDIKNGYGKNTRSPVPYMLRLFNKWNMDMTYTLNRHDNALLLVRSWRNYKNNVNSKKADFIIRRDDKLGEI
jgi:hypothetical protein